jgi:hypothetical protein
MRLVKARLNLFIGARTHGPADPPFAVDGRKAEDLVRRGLADYHVAVDPDEGEVRTAELPGPARARKAVARGGRP